ncbi:MAG: DUF1476 domain-containing protein [Simkaniaceae bacterium]|nr:DUF1476 domain-containing protein [Simkaniaceae bacterium]
MRSSLAEREEAIEKKFQHDNEMAFKIRARRNRLFGYWAGEQLSLKGPELESYAARIVNHTIKNPTDSSLINKVFTTFEEKGIPFTKHQIEKQLLYFQGDAQQELHKGIAI